MIEPKALAAIQATFLTDSVHEGETVATMKLFHRDANLTVDPHTAVGLTATRKAAETEDVVTLATAHPAKFPDAVETATGTKPTLPERMRWILTAPERYETLPNAIGPLKEFISGG
jgi:threonine synthase